MKYEGEEGNVKEGIRERDKISRIGRKWKSNRVTARGREGQEIIEQR